MLVMIIDDVLVFFTNNILLFVTMNTVDTGLVFLGLLMFGTLVVFLGFNILATVKD
jgi:hypothetical protein